MHVRVFAAAVAYGDNTPGFEGLRSTAAPVPWADLPVDHLPPTAPVVGCVDAQNPPAEWAFDLVVEIYRSAPQWRRPQPCDPRRWQLTRAEVETFARLGPTIVDIKLSRTTRLRARAALAHTVQPHRHVDGLLTTGAPHKEP